MLPLPVIVVNLKAYVHCTGDGAVRLAQVCERVANQVQVTIAVAVQPADIYHVRMAARIPVFAQHIDPVESGAHTGAILAQSIQNVGAAGTLLNHSERKLSLGVLAKSITLAKSAGLTTLVCAATPEVAKKIAALEPDMIAIEPPELIGGTVSVSMAKPEVVTATTKCIRNIPILCGAGVKTKQDVVRAMELGVQGILVASGVTLAKNPEQVLKDFASAMQKYK